MAAKLLVPVTRVRTTSEPLPLPRYMTADAAGMDIYADLGEDLTIPPLGRALIPTGFALALPQGYEAQVRPRSGLAWRSGLTVLNSPGTIDADYRDEVRILVINLGDQPVQVRRGDRIAQLVVAPVMRVRWQEVERLEPTGRAGGFGHTDTRKSGDS
ncbi:MAG TPA: dUTP diphosphatase [Candidatus Binatia bacterium]|jgi:dUTP pyrophosphatase|nr:dUTP diphosphatase [Candidatus Binatia bacterium]